jgi:patatin-like phospholipase/acyl hydrolase
MDTNAIRTLTILGGGSRGYLANWLIKKYVIFLYGALTRDNYLKFFSLFNSIGGTSIGGIMALCFALGLTPDDVDSIFLQYGKRIFTSRTTLEKTNFNHNASLDAAFLTEAEKFASMELGENFYESPYSDSNYGHNMLYQVLNEKFGTKRLGDLKTNVVIPSYRINNSQFVIFSNIKDDKYFINNNELLTDVAKATSAAPFYFPTPEFGGYKHWDGGLWANDITEANILAAKIAKPVHSNIISLTISTGLGYWGFGNVDNYNSGDKFLTLAKIKELADVAMGGSEQYTAWKLNLQNDRVLNSIYGQKLYYAKLDPFYTSELDDFSSETTAKMEEAANKYFNDNTALITNSIGHLLA